MTAGQVPTSDAVRGLVQRLLDLGDFTGREQLLAQVAGVEYIEGPVTMMDLRVVGQCASAIGVPSPVPSTPTVVDERGEAIGELLLWLDAQGYINCLEYAWFTDEMPTILPSPDRVRAR
ncbi:MAG: hypothetical protein LCH96_02255 [Actinobacteria bacterium]|nr:hypothetical protein [Actinomycetota bacterium]